MKKFFRKLPVLITFAVVTVLMVALTIGMSVRPISHGMTYSRKDTVAGETVVSTVKFNNGKYLTWKMGDAEATELWYYEEDGRVMKRTPTTGLKYEDYKKAVEVEKKVETTWEANKKLSPKVNAFKLTVGEGEDAVTFTARGAIALVTILAIVDLALVACTTLSVLYTVKKK